MNEYRTKTRTKAPAISQVCHLICSAVLSQTLTREPKRPLNTMRPGEAQSGLGRSLFTHKK